MVNSHEYQTVLSIGEDNIYICQDCWVSHNEELINLETWFVCQKCGSKNHKIYKASEVGNIFPLMTKFTDAFDVKYTDADGKTNMVYMGCYGIGISRLMWVIAEYFSDEKWLVWPENIAPATHYIIVMWENFDTAKKLAELLEKEGKEVIIDDREKVGFWQKASDADLLWIPYRIVVSDKTLEAGWYELKQRLSQETQIISLDK